MHTISNNIQVSPNIISHIFPTFCLFVSCFKHFYWHYIVSLFVFLLWLLGKWVLFMFYYVFIYQLSLSVFILSFCSLYFRSFYFFLQMCKTFFDFFFFITLFSVSLFRSLSKYLSSFQCRSACLFYRQLLCHIINFKPLCFCLTLFLSFVLISQILSI